MVQPVKEVYITAEFGRPGSWAAGYHTGRDYRAPVGTSIYATKKGTVKHAGYGGLGPAYGNHVVIESWHGGYRVRHLYAHLSKNEVRVGQKVATGQFIGRSGATGNVTGPHLHYEERKYPFGYYNHQRPVLPTWTPAIRVSVSLSKVQPGKRNLHVLRVQRRLKNRVEPSLPRTGYFGSLTKKAYAKWQYKLGYRGTAANGVPGKKSLEKLGFTVKP